MQAQYAWKTTATAPCRIDFTCDSLKHRRQVRDDWSRPALTGVHFKLQSLRGTNSTSVLRGHLPIGSRYNSLSYHGLPWSFQTVLINGSGLHVKFATRFYCCITPDSNILPVQFFFFCSSVYPLYSIQIHSPIVKSIWCWGWSVWGMHVLGDMTHHRGYRYSWAVSKQAWLSCPTRQSCLSGGCSWYPLWHVHLCTLTLKTLSKKKASAFTPDSECGFTLTTTLIVIPLI